MKKMEIIYRGNIVEVKKENFYCKAGAYEHKSRKGWALVDSNGKIVLGHRLDHRGHGSERYDYPEFTTRKSLLEAVEYYNAQHVRRLARRSKN